MSKWISSNYQVLPKPKLILGHMMKYGKAAKNNKREEYYREASSELLLKMGRFCQLSHLPDADRLLEAAANKGSKEAAFFRVVGFKENSLEDVSKDDVALVKGLADNDNLGIAQVCICFV